MCLHTPETSKSVGPKGEARRSCSEGGPCPDYDLIVIGGGTGGVRAARYAAKYGARVALSELERGTISSDERGGVGGTCVLRGCVPKKLMAYAGRFPDDFENAKGFGWHSSCDPALDFGELMQHKEKETERLSDLYMKGLKDCGVDVFIGKGVLRDANTVAVGGTLYKAKNILIGTGSYPTIPDIEGAREHGINSDHILYLNDFPKRLIIVGGGYIACEQATIYQSLGSEVHLIIRQELPLKGFDEECRKLVLDQYRLRGVTVHASCSPSRVTKSSDGSLSVDVKPKDGQPFTIDKADQVLFATGRKPRTAGLGLESAGVKLDDAGAVVVDKYSRSASAPSVFAVGDVTNRKPLTPAARMEASCFAMNVFGGDEEAVPDHDNVASVVFSSPEVATVGLSEEAARDQHPDVDVFSSEFVSMKNIMSDRNIKTLAKVVVDASSDRVLGIHMVGEHASEILQGFAACLKVGITKKQLDQTVGIHPTSAEEFVSMAQPSRKYRDHRLVSN